MSEQASANKDWRTIVLSDPDVILEDRDVMRALIAANERQLGGNIVDMRGLAMERLETRLDRLEDTHRSVIAAAYENLAGTNQVHRAILKLLDHAEFEPFLQSLGGEVMDILRVDRMRLVLESAEARDTAVAPPSAVSDLLSIVAPGFIANYLTAGRDMPQRQVTLRDVGTANTSVYGEDAEYVRSEALLKLDLGPGRLPGLLAMGAEDPNQFRSNQGTDLLSFFTGVFERTMRQHLA
ncbi:DUF484 family protein [Thalassobacter stenotrophicus]|uniref:Recombinase XerC n=2 Tax=Thalassobacter stenotrophicus TaxID=266809 RepID=A0A0P1EW49_9RHOB|nr:DUF484 family protein [Thalassobacter stenotrophicus]PVZ50089.1 DUF484 domain-containing protein [Thalassobacter stenotrophicus]CUH59198.1 hypothetical protein THS5294_00481 [Thalassobacter stenotrophicus]SHI95935.1 hypothetical protein SAMN02744035_02137 [Thalassobacter stenotrophicus DSM 16310]